MGDRTWALSPGVGSGKVPGKPVEGRGAVGVGGEAVGVGGEAGSQHRPLTAAQAAQGS